MPKPYAGLKPMKDGAFPKTCPMCQRVFPDMADFIQNTLQVRRSSGLFATRDNLDNTIIVLMRNCRCGTSIAMLCLDRRDASPAGLERRQRFEMLHGTLPDSGELTETLRSEILARITETETEHRSRGS